MRFYMSTRQTSAFVSLVDAIRDITPDLSIAVSPDGLRMRKTAMHDAMLVSFNMPVGNFDEFECEGAGVLEWPCEVLAQVLHTSVIWMRWLLRATAKLSALPLFVLRQRRTAVCASTVACVLNRCTDHY